MKIFENALVIKVEKLGFLKSYLIQNNSKRNLILLIGDSNAKTDSELIGLMKEYPRCAYVIAPQECELHFIDLAEKIMLDEALLEVPEFKSKLANRFLDTIQIEAA